MKYVNFSSAAAETVTAKFNSKNKTSYVAWGKRTLDLTLGVFLFILLVPVILVLLLIVRRDGAEGIFGHKRVGQDGELFKCYKIRSMVPNAEGMLEDYLAANPDAADEWAKTQKLNDDPRVTRIGHFLRKTSLDELPQVWNVLRGDMSFVGPRPVTEPELDRYGPDQQSYLSLKPGITGVWQVKGRSDGSYSQRCQMDRYYARRIGLLLDLSLIARTALVFVRPTGR